MAVLVLVWWVNLSGPVREILPLSDDTYRDAAYAENILLGRIAEDPSMLGLPYWYAPGGPLLYAALSKLTGVRPLELYGYSVLWLHVWIPVGFYFVVRRCWDPATALLAMAMVWLCSRWWQTCLLMPMPSIQATILVLLSLVLWREALRRGYVWSVLLGVMLAISAWHHIVSTLVVCGAIACHALFWMRGPDDDQRFAALRRAAVAGGVCVVLVSPLAWHLLRLPVVNPGPATYYGPQLDDPVFALHAATPLMWPFALIGLVIVARRPRQPAAWVLGYLAIAVAGQVPAYAFRYLRLTLPVLLPHEFQWHGQLALGILAAIGIIAVARRLTERIQTPALRRVAAVACVAVMVLLVAAPDRLRGPLMYDDYWRTGRCHPDVMATMDWIRDNSTIEDVFVCGYMTGYYEVVAWTGRKLILMPENRANMAADVVTRRRDLSRLTTTTDPDRFLSIAVDRHGARFVYLSDAERILCERWSTWDIFETAYRSPEGKRTVLRIVDRRKS